VRFIIDADGFSSRSRVPRPPATRPSHRGPETRCERLRSV